MTIPTFCPYPFTFSVGSPLPAYSPIPKHSNRCAPTQYRCSAGVSLLTGHVAVASRFHSTAPLNSIYFLLPFICHSCVFGIFLGWNFPCDNTFCSQFSHCGNRVQGITYLVEKGMLVYEPRAVARFLLENCDKLDKTQVRKGEVDTGKILSMMFSSVNEVPNRFASSLREISVQHTTAVMPQPNTRMLLCRSPTHECCYGTHNSVL